MCEGISIGGNVSIQISGGGGPSVAEIQSGLATAAALAALATSVAEREQQVSVNAPNHIAVTVDMSSATWKTVGTHEVFTVTGAVRMRLWVECTESLTGDGALSVGVESNTNICFGSQTLAPTHAGMMLLPSTSSASTDFSTAVSDRVIFGEDVGYEIVNDPATDGTLIFHCIWEPLSAGATVVAGAGGPL